MHECDKLGVCIQMFRVFLENAWNGLFACQSPGKNIVVGSFYGSLAHANLGKQPQMTESARKSTCKSCRSRLTDEGWS